ncbi:hypothetical protein EMIHUDRAFT_452510 [Emiliania huxleyi CCMP1516]|uniref:Uncharacterized protein n=2 Tax=Emiliania huxleyi TaxID=2903 RepID=A0A0D3IIR0_EMIH1|nr:hypothetical protein EMIHUDRAFT_452510 [Emiliania huxleyi CCMP1516]EOD11145.1 hypothetical protein EMIHUDRAFT_452510 [Emiliania huxleyi CCMP1516]|eukprot:XP_005763574.1 hypothetical protein EMIHUDRAFT_452510 [Emiliania huxleyi CCMP1516]
MSPLPRPLPTPPAAGVFGAYNWSRFPAAWFGANGTEWESAAQLEEIGRYSLAILGWQHLATSTDMTAVIYPQLAQAALLKDRHPALPVLVYASFGWAFGMNAAVWPLMHKPEYEGFFLLSTDGKPEFSRTNCQQMRSASPHCVGWFWNFANSSARDYYVEHIVLPLALSPTIDGVFFDAFNYGYDIPEVRPWGRRVVNVPNCSTVPASGGAAVWSGCEALLDGTLDVARRSARLLNARGKAPMFANVGSFARPARQRIWLNESRLLEALRGARYSVYYESFRGDVAPRDDGAGTLRNMLQESSRGVAATVHTYYKSADEDPLPHVAAFLLARAEGWYFLGSTGWWDKSYRWTSLYDAAGRCGRPLGAATNQSHKYLRPFEGCVVSLDCTGAAAQPAEQTAGGTGEAGQAVAAAAGCVGNISFHHAAPAGGAVQEARSRVSA